MNADILGIEVAC